MMKQLFLLAARPVTNCGAQKADLDQLQLPDGFSIAIHAEVENPRRLALGAGNTVFGGVLRSRGWAITDGKRRYG